MSESGHQRRSHVDGMSAVASIATELLREGNGRKGPAADMIDLPRMLCRMMIGRTHLRACYRLCMISRLRRS